MFSGKYTLDGKCSGQEPLKAGRNETITPKSQQPTFIDLMVQWPDAISATGKYQIHSNTIVATDVITARQHKISSESDTASKRVHLSIKTFKHFSQRSWGDGVSHCAAAHTEHIITPRSCLCIFVSRKCTLTCINTHKGVYTERARAREREQFRIFTSLFNLSFWCHFCLMN